MRAVATRHGPYPSGSAAARKSSPRERQAAGEPSVRYRKPKDRRTRQRRWRDAVQELFDIQADCQVWLDNLPEGFHLSV